MVTHQAEKNVAMTSPSEPPLFVQTRREGKGVSMSSAISSVLN